ncbi:MAG TPA: Fur family transcriptional regulator [Candidatus Paceibacterota bacterium]|nr:Fur family transcriptional regulator [Candidatus Paceibacterota bacterium]
MQKETFDPAGMLHQAGYRATPGRIKLLRVFAQEHRPMTVDQIHTKLGRSTINEVTLYRAIEALASSHIVRRVNLQQGTAQHYELADKHHHHIVCTQCDRVEDFADKDCEELVRKATTKSNGFKEVTSHSIELFGLCKDCA